MLPEADALAVEAAWSRARSDGALGSASIKDLWEHTAGYTSAVCFTFGLDARSAALRIVDVGSGVGIPGVLLAAQLPLSKVVSLDASERRGDSARRAAGALFLQSRVSVVHGRAEDMARAAGWRQGFDVAVARLLGDPAESAELLAPFVRDCGLVVVSAAQRQLSGWLEADLSPVGLDRAEVFATEAGSFVVMKRVGDIPSDYPRRCKVRGRSPLF